MTKLEELTKDFVITLNGINAEIYETKNGILISNNDFSSASLDYDELHLPYEEFKKKLLKNDGKFTTT